MIGQLEMKRMRKEKCTCIMIYDETPRMKDSRSPNLYWIQEITRVGQN